jgi:PHD/YefM family antitoxin component YafN of YafNO toxin-antitoxin module
MTKLAASATRIPPAAFNQVAFKGERIRIERRGGDVVYLISAEDLALLEELEDRYWAEEGKAALARFEHSKARAIPWSETAVKTRRR